MQIVEQTMARWPWYAMATWTGTPVTFRSALIHLMSGRPIVGSGISLALSEGDIEWRNG